MIIYENLGKELRDTYIYIGTAFQSLLESCPRALFLMLYAGCFPGRATGTANHLIHWLYHLNHLSLHYCRLLLDDGVRA